MFCFNCGYKLPNGPKFCSNCGVPINKPEEGDFSISQLNPPFPEKYSRPLLQSESAVHPHNPRSPNDEVKKKEETEGQVVGTKWLKFWTYFSLPANGTFGLLVSIGEPQKAFILIPLSLGFFVVSYGLQRRLFWAWQCNWVVIVLFALVGAIPNSFTSNSEFWAKFFLFLPFLGILWLWPNYVYWKKRKMLFE